jgi:glycerol-3-phosphate dehydrogenase
MPRSTSIETRFAGVSLDPAIKATARLSEIAACDLMLMVTPAWEVRAIADELALICAPIGRS